MASKIRSGSFRHLFLMAVLLDGPFAVCFAMYQSLPCVRGGAPQGRRGCQSPSQLR